MTFHRQRIDTAMMNLAVHRFALNSYRTVSKADRPKSIDWSTLLNRINFSAFGVRRQCMNDFLQASRICESARDFDNGVNCQICAYDGCNSANSYGPIAAVLIAVPIALIQFLWV